jgi:serine/threonine protein phosphatase 1
MLRAIISIFRKPAPEKVAGGRPRLSFPKRPSAIYAIGDIHGCYEQLRNLERKIVLDGEGIAGEKWLIYLGDYIDRGPASANVIDHLMAPAPAGFKRMCIAGNHEDVIVNFIDSDCRDNGWLSFGGVETLASYGLYGETSNAKRLAQKIASYIPGEHIEFLRSLPEMISVPGYCFVHAGIDPGIAESEQSSKTLLWSRPNDFAWENAKTASVVVHGHTPVPEVEITPCRVNVDTGAYSSGNLSAIKISKGKISVINSL